MWADFPMMPHESALFSSVCKPISLGIVPSQVTAKASAPPDTMVGALVRGSPRSIRRGWRGQKPLIFMYFHGVLLGSQHEMWSKQHNGKVRNKNPTDRRLL